MLWLIRRCRILGRLFWIICSLCILCLISTLRFLFLCNMGCRRLLILLIIVVICFVCFRFCLGIRFLASFFIIWGCGFCRWGWLWFGISMGWKGGILRFLFFWLLFWFLIHRLLVMCIIWLWLGKLEIRIMCLGIIVSKRIRKCILGRICRLGSYLLVFNLLDCRLLFYG